MIMRKSRGWIGILTSIIIYSLPIIYLHIKDSNRLMEVCGG